MKELKFLTGILALSLLAGCTSIEKYQNQEKIDKYIQTGMTYYWEGGDLKQAEKDFFKGITLKGKYDVVENYFKEASSLAPDRLDLRFGIASSQILQNKTAEALDTYREIVKIYPKSFEANMLLAGYTKVQGNVEEFNNIIENMKKVYPDETAQFEERFIRTDKVMDTKFEIEAFKEEAPNNVIVTLGYALGKGGVMEKPLLGRLEQTLKMAQANPTTPIIVTGGVQQGGVTEGYVMKKWLVENGISPNRIYIEDQAKDTVGNAYYSVKIMKELGAQNMTLITSASHMRRALAVFQEMAISEGLELDKLSNLVYLDYDSLEAAYEVPIKEQLVIYRDMMRAAGIWSYPGIQR